LRSILFKQNVSRFLRCTGIVLNDVRNKSEEDEVCVQGEVAVWALSLRLLAVARGRSARPIWPVLNLTRSSDSRGTYGVFRGFHNWVAG
jgi:hypothetical protein